MKLGAGNVGGDNESDTAQSAPTSENEHEHEHALFAEGYALATEPLFPSSPRNPNDPAVEMHHHTMGGMATLSTSPAPGGEKRKASEAFGPASGNDVVSSDANSSLPSDMIDSAALGGLVGEAPQQHQSGGESSNTGGGRKATGGAAAGSTSGSTATATNNPSTSAAAADQAALFDRLMHLEDDARQKLCSVIDTINRITATTTQLDSPAPPVDEATVGMSEAQRSVWVKYASAAHDVVQAQQELEVLLESYADVLSGVLSVAEATAGPSPRDVLERLGLSRHLRANSAEESEPSPDEGWTRETQYWFRSPEGFLHFVPSDSLDPDTTAAANAGQPAASRINRFRMPPLDAFYDVGQEGPLERPPLGPDCCWDTILPMVKRQDMLWTSYPIPTLGQFSPQDPDPADPKFWSEVETGIVRLWAYYKVDAETPSLSTLRKHFGSSWLTSSQMRSRWKRLQEIQRYIENRVDVEGTSIFIVARDLAGKMQNYRNEEGKENPILSLAMLSDLLVAERTGGVGAHIPKRASKKRKPDHLHLGHLGHGGDGDSPLTPMTPDGGLL